MVISDHTLLCGLTLLMIGSYIRYRIGRNRFNRRNVAGLQQFRSYGHAIFVRFGEAVSI